MHLGVVLSESRQAQQTWWSVCPGPVRSEACSLASRGSGPPKTKAKCYIHCLEFVESLLQTEPALVTWC